MAIYVHGVRGTSAVINYLAGCTNVLLSGHTIALRDGSQTAAAIIPWAAVRYLGDASLENEMILQDAAKLARTPAIPTDGPSGKTARMNATMLRRSWPATLDDIQDGAMVTFIHSKSPVGLFVQPMVVRKLAGQTLPAETEVRLQTGIRDVLKLEEDIHSWRYTSPAQRAANGLRNPLTPP